MVTSWWDKQPAAMRLTVSYVAIIMAISLLFSAALYRVSAGQLDDSLHRQYLRYRLFSSDYIEPPNPPALEREMQAGHEKLQLQLVYFNLIILLVGSGLSYWLAQRTLQPIEEALDAQSRFTADASHELRTPLTAMQTEIEVALRNNKLSKDDAKALLTSNLEEVGKLRALSEALLQLARGDGQVQLESVPLANITNEAINRVIPLAKTKKISIDEEVGKLSVMADEGSLTQLLVILLDNAIKYSEPKKVVKLNASKQGKWAVITVADEGQGIKASDLPHIFDRFFRSDLSRSRQKVEGYGLGLSIAQNIAELHNGSIDVKSTAGKGSTFTVKIPLAV